MHHSLTSETQQMQSQELFEMSAAFVVAQSTLNDEGLSNMLKQIRSFAKSTEATTFRAVRSSTVAWRLIHKRFQIAPEEEIQRIEAKTRGLVLSQSFTFPRELRTLQKLRNGRKPEPKEVKTDATTVIVDESQSTTAGTHITDHVDVLCIMLHTTLDVVMLKLMFPSVLMMVSLVERALSGKLFYENKGNASAVAVREIRRRKNLLRGPMSTKGNRP
ncbi:hypothetical protein TNCV_4214331 [Trichonephila clavipes]|nr:hypothetical protein TNCV_4214331 [Trichonephila clavipes]